MFEFLPKNKKPHKMSEFREFPRKIFEIFLYSKNCK